MATTSTKPALSALKTPISATYPSELRSPMVSTPTYIKREEGQQTPITPPAAYLDFLKTLSPVLMSPLPSGASTKFTFGENRPSSTYSTTSITSTTSTASTDSATSTSGPIPADKPSPTSSNRSSRASSCCNCEHPMSPPSTTSPAPAKVEMAISIPPPSPFMRPMSARTPRLFIPQSPFTPATARSPMSAHSVHSPYSATMSPRSWDLEKSKVGGSTTRAVSVRQVVTRTVTYSRTPIEAPAPAPLDPAPKGKRRKIE
ncbi:hypothetical protein AOQ84DRAFT_374502 [Glonium stellatum]|uniref:Uncharacterized protein n=1 Tax=Glonium stellatum TaxID=574774 RepID=A0A8E2F5N2_9PEZI|nr:hypothetical protein AOQ84DRAFT_374502 [Glonium stellatum]